MFENIQVTLQVGKSGVTPRLIDELFTQLKTRKVVKIKLLRSALESVDRKEIANTLVSMTHAELMSLVGNVVVLKKRG
jgi:RNA-binding protein